MRVEVEGGEGGAGGGGRGNPSEDLNEVQLMKRIMSIPNTGGRMDECIQFKK